MKIDKQIIKSVSIIITLFKSILSGFSQVLWLIIAIAIFRRGDMGVIELSNLELFNLILNKITTHWLGLSITIGVFYFIINIREITPTKPEAKE